MRRFFIVILSSLVMMHANVNASGKHPNSDNDKFTKDQLLHIVFSAWHEDLFSQSANIRMKDLLDKNAVYDNAITGKKYVGVNAILKDFQRFAAENPRRVEIGKPTFSGNTATEMDLIYDDRRFIKPAHVQRKITINEVGKITKIEVKVVESDINLVKPVK